MPGKRGNNVPPQPVHINRRIAILKAWFPVLLRMNALTIVYQAYHVEINQWWSYGPCQNDISFRNSQWMKAGPDYSGYNKMSTAEWHKVCKSGKIWSDWAKVFDDSILNVDKTIFQDIDSKNMQLVQLLSSPSKCKTTVYDLWQDDFRSLFTYISTFIEGGKYTHDEVRKLIIFNTPVESKSQLEAWELEDHAAAWEFVLQELATKPLSQYTLVDILNTHGYLTRRTLPHAFGRIRNHEVWLSNSPLVTPRKEEVHQLLLDLVSWLNTIDTTLIHPVVVAAAFHIRFASIHPFTDGNGRMVRLMTNAILISTRYAPITVGGEYDLPPAKQKQLYYIYLRKYTEEHDIIPFLQFFMDGELGSITHLLQALNECK